MYLLEETLDAIEESGHTTDDVLYVGSEDGRLQLPWDQAEPVLRVRYDNGYGDQEIATDLCVRFTDGAMLVRCEYDGAEWWREHMTQHGTCGLSPTPPAAADVAFRHGREPSHRGRM